MVYFFDSTTAAAVVRRIRRCADRTGSVSSQPPLLLLCGEQGTGKTKMMRQVATVLDAVPNFKVTEVSLRASAELTR